MDPSTENTFRHFVDTRSPELLTTAYLITGEHDAAEHLLHETLVRTYLSWPRTKDAAEIEHGVRRTMARMAASRWRRRRHRGRSLPQIPAMDGVDGFVEHSPRFNAEHIVRAGRIAVRRRRIRRTAGAAMLVVLALAGSSMLWLLKPSLAQASCPSAGGSPTPHSSEPTGQGQSATWDLLEHHVIRRRDGATVSFPLPSGDNPDGGRRTPSGWVISVDTGMRQGPARMLNKPRELWFVQECRVPRRIAVAETYALSRDGRVVVAATDTTVTAYQLPSLKKLGQIRPDLTQEDYATGLRPVGLSGTRVLLAWRGVDTGEVGIWDYQTGRFTYGNGPSKHGNNPAEVTVLSMSDDGQVLRTVRQLDARRSPTNTCIDVVPFGDQLPIGDTGTCGREAELVTRRNSTAGYAAISPDGKWALLRLIETEHGSSIGDFLTRTEDIRSGQLKPIPLTVSDGRPLWGDLNAVFWKGAEGFVLGSGTLSMLNGDPAHSDYCRFDGRCTQMTDEHPSTSIILRADN